MKKCKEMTGIEQIAWRNIKMGFNWEAGGWYNCLQDGCPEYIPDTEEEAKQFLYEEVIVNKYGAGYCGSHKAPKEMRFAGKAFIMECIDYLFEKDEDIAAIREEKGW